MLAKAFVFPVIPAIFMRWLFWWMRCAYPPYISTFLVDALRLSTLHFYALYPPYILYPPGLSGSGLSPADEIPRHVLQVARANHAGGLAQAQVSQQVVVARQRQVAFGGEQLLLRVEYVEVGAHAALDALLRGFDQQACGFDGFRLRADAQRSAQRLAVVFAQVDQHLAGLSLEVGPGLFVIGHRLAGHGAGVAARVQRHIELDADAVGLRLLVVGVDGVGAGFAAAGDQVEARRVAGAVFVDFLGGGFDGMALRGD